MRLLSLSTAAQEVILGPFMQTDGVTPRTGLTINATDIDVWKHGGTSRGTKNEATAATELAEGYYYCVLDATDTNTAGQLELHITTATGGTFLPVREVFHVSGSVAGIAAVDATYWNGTAVADSGTAGYPDVNVKEVDDTALDTHDAGSFPADVRSMIGSTVPVQAMHNLYRYGVITHGNGGTGATSTTVDFTGATNIPASSAANDSVLVGRTLVIYAGVGSQQSRQIVAYDGTTQVVTVSPAFEVTPDATSDFLVLPDGPADVESWLGTAVVAPATAGTPSVDVVSVSGDTGAADNLELDYDGTGYNKSNSTIGTTTTNTDLVTAASIADAVLDEALADHSGAGSLGKAITDIETDATAILEDTATSIPALIAALNDPAVTAIADGVWDEPLPEPAVNDAAFPSTPRKALAYVLAFATHKSTLNRTTGAYALRDSGDLNDMLTGTHSDDGTSFTKGTLS